MDAADSFVLDSAGDVCATGENTENPLGNGATASALTPVLIDSSVGMVSSTSNDDLDLHP
jgi:hypothetical protein